MAAGNVGPRSQQEVYRFLDSLHRAGPDEATDDRILEVADFVAAFCSAHMRIWDAPAAVKPTGRET